MPRLFADVDPLTARECADAYLGGYTGDYFFKNRFAGTTVRCGNTDERAMRSSTTR